MMGKIRYGIIVILFVTGCRNEGLKTLSGSEDTTVTGNYAVIENYEIAEGPHAGFKGSSAYTIRVGKDSIRHLLLIENIANAYTVKGIQNGDSVFLLTQKYPYHRDSVILSGSGKFSGDSLVIKLFSGGPAGQIKSDCRAKKMYLK